MEKCGDFIVINKENILNFSDCSEVVNITVPESSSVIRSFDADNDGEY